MSCLFQRQLDVSGGVQVCETTGYTRSSRSSFSTSRLGGPTAGGLLDSLTRSSRIGCSFGGGNAAGRFVYDGPAPAQKQGAHAFAGTGRYLWAVEPDRRCAGR